MARGDGDIHSDRGSGYPKACDTFDAERRGIFLDRDGTLNVKPPDGDYLRRADDFRWIPGAARGAAALARGGFRLFVVSNQRGVARGLVEEATLAQIDATIQETLNSLGAEIEAFRYCTHDVAAGCYCRKPKPGMILSLVREYRLTPGACWMIGDSLSDVAAGNAAGCATAFLGDPAQASADVVVPDLVAPSLLLVSESILHEPNRSTTAP